MSTSNSAGSDTGLTPAKRRALRARAHALDPVVLLGDKGLTPAVLAEIERALAFHELLKIRAQPDREERKRVLDEICLATRALPVQHIGRILVIYREKPAQAAVKRKARKRPAGKSLRRDAVDRTAPERPETDRIRATPGRARRPGTATARRNRTESTGTGRPVSRTASPRRAPARPPGRRRTSR